MEYKEKIVVKAKDRMLTVNIITLEKAKDNFFNSIEKTNTCWIYKGLIGTNGYGRCRYYKNPMYAHRFSWLIHHGEIPKKLHVLHSCDVKSCVNPNHLRLGTHQDNMKDMHERGTTENHEYKKHPERIRNGQQLKCAKLTKIQADEIRASYKPRIISTYKLAKKYGVSQGTIMFILKNITYKNETYKRRLE